MLIVRASPTRLRQARDFTAIGRFAQLGARQSKLPIHAAGAAGDGTAITLPGRACVARLLLQFHLRGGALLLTRLRIADQLFQLGASLSVLTRYFEAALLAHEHVRLGHELLPYLRNGKLKASKSARPCLSSCADVDMVISIPRILSIWSY